MTFFARLGHISLRKSSQYLQIFYLILATLSRLASLRNQAVMPILLRQIYFTGFETARVIITISLAIGMVIIAQVILLVGSTNASMTGKVLIWTIVRELGPLLTALVVIARSGAAIATELATMKQNGEIEALEGLGIDPIDYLIVPRIIGGTLAVYALTIYFEVGAIAGGFLVASLGWHLPSGQFSQGIYAAMTMQELTMSGIKSIIFGLFITAASCQQGMAVGKSATMIPQVATQGVMHSLFLVFVFDGIVTLTFQYLQAG